MAFEEVLRSRRAAIVQLFVERAAETVPGQTVPPVVVITEHVPSFLRELATALETRRSTPPPAKVAAQQHAQARWHQGMDARSLVREYALLRACTLEIAGHPGPEDLAVIDRFFNSATSEAVAEHVAMADAQAAALRSSLELENQHLSKAQAVLALLAEAGAILAAASADHRQALQGLATLCVPRLADCCSVYLSDRDAPQHLAIAHVVPEKIEQVRHLYERFPLPSSAPHGFPAALRTGRSELQCDITDTAYRRMATSPAHLAALRSVGAISWMVVPLSVEGQAPFAAMSLVNAESKRNFTAEDLALAEELGRRAALTLDRARLFEAARRERARAEEATHAKDEFLAVVSHELRTPLNSILGWSRLLRDLPPDAERLARGLEVIDRNATHQAQLISDLLDVSRIVTGAVRLEVGSVDLASLVEMAVVTIFPAADAKSIHIETLLDGSTGLIRGDVARLQQIVWNLLTNAVKFTPKHGWVRVRLARVGSDVELVVEDSGSGIDPAVLPFLFERFRQEDTSVVRAFGGLGLGLSIARHLVELHGGTVTARSPGKGQGTTFTVRLPISPVPSTAPTQPALSPRDQAGSPLGTAKVEGMRVLVVEDQQDARELLAELLHLYGVDARTAESVATGLEEFHRFRPDVVLSDIGLPGEDGYALARKIRALTDGAGGNTPMVALTAFTDAASRERALLEGFSAHLGKPVESSDLLELLGSLRFRSS